MNGGSVLFSHSSYGLLGLSLFDIIDILSHCFGDPGWEFQIVRNLVERAPVPLLGLVAGWRKFADFQVLSWASL